MELYFSPLACSMATRVALYEAGATATYVQVDAKTKRTSEGSDFFAVNPMGLVPVIRTDEGDLLTENAAILQYVAQKFPDARLAPGNPAHRLRLQQWLCFIGTELHKAVFGPLLDPKAPEGAKIYALSLAPKRLDLLEHHLKTRELLLDDFSVADAYLVTVLGWAVATPVDLSQWPAVAAYLERTRKRPSVAKAFSEELALYVEEQRKTAS